MPNDPEFAFFLAALIDLALSETEEERPVTIGELVGVVPGYDHPAYLSVLAEKLVDAGYLERAGIGYAPTATAYFWGADRDEEMAHRMMRRN